VTKLNVGDVAPDFTLPGSTVLAGEATKAHFTLSERRGSTVVLAFYPADNSPGCTAQLCSYQDEMDAFRELGADVWGISRQTTKSHTNFARTKRLGFPLLADEKGDVVDAYGVGLLGLGVRRSIFIVNPEGRIAWKHVALVGVTFQSADTIKAELARI
jgi:thioredoxin-dependent peroxiredoxin